MKRKGAYQHFQGRDRKYYFRLVSVNGKTICQSEGYDTKAACIRGIQAVRLTAPYAKVVEVPR